MVSERLRNSLPFAKMAASACGSFRPHSASYHGDVIDATEGREELGPQGFWECRAADAFVHEPVGGQRDDENIPEFAGVFKVPDVADVKEIEDTVTEYDPLAVGAEAIEDGGEFIKWEELAVRCHTCESLHGTNRVVRLGRSEAEYQVAQSLDGVTG